MKNVIDLLSEIKNSLLLIRFKVVIEEHGILIEQRKKIGDKLLEQEVKLKQAIEILEKGGKNNEG